MAAQSTSSSSPLLQEFYDISERIAENEAKRKLGESLEPGNDLYEAILQGLDDDVDDKHAATRAVIEHQLEQLEEEYDDLTEQLDTQKDKLAKVGIHMVDEGEEEEDVLMHLAADIHQHQQSDWKIKADQELDRTDLPMCPSCDEPKQNNTRLATRPGEYFCIACSTTWTCPINAKRGASGFKGLDPSLDRTATDLQQVYSNPTRYESEVHVLQRDNDGELGENDGIADTTMFYDDEQDMYDDDTPVKMLETGAIYHDMGRIDPCLAKHLMLHQCEGIQFVLDAFAKQHGAVLALSMGMGKTLSTLAILDVIAQRLNPCYIMVLAPQVIAPNWEKEFDMWSPPNLNLHPVIMKLNAASRRTLKNARENGGLVVATIDTFRMHYDEFGKPTVVVIDEAHRIKNNRSQLFAAVNTIATPYKLALTGTPLQNNLQECYTLINWINPSLLGSQRQFQKCFGDDIEDLNFQDKSRKRVHMLKEKLDSVVFRRDDMSSLLPPKEEYRLVIDCSGIAIEKRSCFAQYQDTITACMEVKLPVICMMLTQIEKLGDKAVIFSGRNAVLQRLATILHGDVMLGETGSEARQEMIDAFQTGSNPRIYVSTRTGSQGINLTAGTHVIIADASFNPSYEMQAVCRCWRIRQTKPVYVYRIIAGGTIEDIVYQQQITKFALFSRIVDDKEIDSVFTDDGGSLSLQDLNVDSLSGNSHSVLKPLQHLFTHITLHQFSEASDLSPMDKEAAKNEYHVICSKHSRTLMDENGFPVECAPDINRVGSLFVPPFPLVVTGGDSAVVLHPIIPAFPRCEIQRCTRELDFEYVTVDDNTLSNITRVACEPGEYAFRVRGIDPDDRMVGPWSELSAFVVVK